MLGMQGVFQGCLGVWKARKAGWQYAAQRRAARSIRSLTAAAQKRAARKQAAQERSMPTRALTKIAPRAVGIITFQPIFMSWS